MKLQELGKYFYGRDVEFKLKNGKTKTIFVQDIMNEEDEEPELTFIGGSEENEVRISEIVSACEIKK